MSSLLILLLSLLVPAAGAESAQPEELRMWMAVGERRFAITVTDNAAAHAFAAQLPLTLEMSELNGNEKHAELPKPLPADASRPGTIRNGDLMLYGADTLVAFYRTFQSSYSYTRVGRVDDPSELPQALGPRGVRVVFSKASVLNERGHDERHNESASWLLAAVRLADSTCDSDVLVRPRFRRNARGVTWKSSAVVHNHRPKGQRSGSPAPSASIRCSTHLCRRALPERV